MPLKINGIIFPITATQCDGMNSLSFSQIAEYQRFLFASIAASLCLIYLDIQHSTNEVKNRVIVHMIAATIGWFTYLIIGPGYPSG